MADRYDDFKYVIQDTNVIYFGRELTYNELIEREDVPFKLKMIINSHITKDIPQEAKVAEHMLSISPNDFSYRIYEQLKMTVRISFLQSKKNIFGKTRTKNVHKACPVRQFCNNYRTDVIEGMAQIEEFSISKLALMMISI